MRKKLIIFISIIIASLLISISSVALFNAYFKKFPTEITTTNISFLYNNKSYLNDISTEDITLVKGEPTELELKVETKGGAKIVADYTVSLYASEESTNTTKLIDAIDLYKYNGYRYEYVSKLSDLSKDNLYQITGTCISNNVSTIKLALVYNAEINDTYFSESLKNKVLIHTEANAEISTSSSFYTFVSTADELTEALKETNKEIVLTSDITYSSDVTATNIGIDLNGHNLALNGTNIISFDDLMDERLYFGDLTNSTTSSITGTIKLSGNAVEVYNNYSSCFTYDASDTTLLTSLANKLESKANQLSKIKEYKTGDTFDILDGYYQYINSINLSSNVLELDKTSKTIKVKDYSNETTSNFYIVVNDKTIYNQILLSDTSINSVLERIKTSLSGYIVNSSIPLLNYDNISKSHIEYIINDNNQNNILSSTGIYQPNGLDYVKSMTSVSLIKPKIIIKITNEHSSLTYTLKDNETINLIPLTELQLQSLLVTYIPFEMIPDSTNETITYDTFLSSYKDKLSQDVTTSVSSVNIEDACEDYVTIDENEKKVSLKNDNIKTNSIYETYFTFNTAVNFNNVLTYTFDSKLNITILGKEKYVTKYDISNRLSSKFNENDYINGSEYNFTGYGSLCPTLNGTKTPIYVKYEIVDSAHESFVAIIYEYNLVTELESQVSYFVKNSDEYTFVDESNAVKFSLDNQEYYFISTTELADQGITYKGTTYTFNDQTYALLYKYDSYIQIKPNLVPQDEVTNVKIKATLYSDSSFNTPYQEDLIYNFTFPVEGIIHYGNGTNNVKDYLLYQALLKCFDKNNDSLISYSESRQTMSEIKANLDSKGVSYYKTDSTYNISYLDFSSIYITTLEGIENFPNITGLSFKNSGISSLDSLESLYSLKYLNCDSNKITDLSSLSLLDDLEYLSLSNDLVTSIEPLRYLSNLKYLNLYDNKIIDLDPLSNMTNLKYLDLGNMKNGSIEFTNDPKISYLLALIMVNSNSPTILTGSNATFTIGDEAKVAVTILKNLERINRVNQKLYLPSSYTDGSTTYAVSWTSNNSKLTLTKGTNGYYEATVSDSIIDEEVEFYIQVGSVGYLRTMKATVYKTNESSVYDRYIYVPSTQSYFNLTTSGFDSNLVNVLFDKFNSDASETSVSISDNVTVSEKYVISAADYNTIINSSDTTLSIDLSYNNITSLTGLSYFVPYITRNNTFSNIDIDLEGNAIDSLKELNNLGTINSLKIGSNKYDFNELLSGEKGATDEKTLLTISKLYVYECYDLDDYDILSSLFRYYFISSNKVSIYLKDGSTEWNPYEDLLPYKMSILPSAVTFKKTGTINLFNTNGLYTNSEGIAIDFYGYTHYFKRGAEWGDVTLLTRSNTGEKAYNAVAFQTYNNYFDLSSDGILRYKSYILGNEASYLTTALKYTNSSKNLTISYDYLLQINTIDISSDITVTLDSESKTLKETFNSLELKEKIISLAINAGSLSDTDTTLTVDEINNLGLESFKFTQMSSPSSESIFKGLKYITTLKEITVDYDFNFDNAEELVNITKIIAKNSYVDFTTLTTTLTNLTTLNFSQIYGFKVPEGTGTYLPNLSSLTIDSTKGASDYEYFDLHQLVNFIYEDDDTSKSNLSYMYLNNINTKNKNGFTSGYVNNIIVKIRNAYYNKNKGNSYNEPEYYIGTTKTNANIASYGYVCYKYVDDDITKGINYCYLSTDSTQKWTSVAEKSTTEITVTPNKKDSDSNITDFGLKYGDSLDSATNWNSVDESSKVKLNKDTKLYLPTNTKYFMFSLQNDNTVLTNDNAMTWYVTYRDSSGNKVLGNTISGTETNGYIEYTLSLDAYYIICGTIPNKSAVFVYQFVVGSGDGIYSLFTNYNLRFITFYFAELDQRVNAWKGLSLVQDNGIKYSDFAEWCNTGINLHNCTNWISGYDNYINISSIDDYSNDTIKNYLFDSTNGKFKDFYELNIPNLKYDDFSSFAKLTNVTKLSISGSQFKFDENSFTNYTKITELNVSGCTYFSPTALKSLLDVNTNISSFNLTGTMCEYNYKTFELFSTWGRTDNFSLTINGSTITTSSSVILSELNKIKTDLTNTTYDIEDETNPIGYIYANRGSSKKTTTSTYTLNFDYVDYFITAINSYQLTSSTAVPVNIKVTDSSFNIFNDIPVSFNVTYNKITEAGKFENGKAISDLNYELIAYAIKENALTYDSGFKLTKNVYISSDFAYLTDNNLTNFYVTSDSTYLILKFKSDSTYAFYISKESYIKGLYAYFEKYKLYKSGSTQTDTKQDAKTGLDWVKNYKYVFDVSSTLPTSDSPYLYYDSNTSGNEVILTVTLNTDYKYMYVDGVKYNLELTTENDYSAKGITIQNNVLTIDSSVLINSTNKFEYNENIEIKLKYQLTNDNGTVYATSNNTEATIVLYHASSEDNYVADYNLYVLAKGNSTDGFYLSTNDETSNKKTTFDTSKVVLTNSSYKVSESGTVGIIPASCVFESGQLISTIIRNDFGNAALSDVYDATGRIIGKVLTNIDTITEINTNESGNLGNEYVTSLEGLQYFVSLNILQLSKNIYGSLDPIKDLHLERFFYQTTSDKPYTNVEDFTPLLEGSSKTLKVFQFGGNAASALTDMSFLLNFKNLEYVYLENKGNSSNSIGKKYVLSQEFAYLTYQLNNKGVKVILMDGSVGGYVVKNYQPWTGNEWCIKVNDNYIEGINLLSLYSSSSFSKTPALTNDYLLEFDKSNSSYYKTDSTGNYIYLPATIEENGKLHLLSYTTDTYNVSNNINNLGYYLVSDSKETKVDKSSETVEANSYYLSYLAKTEILYVKFKVNDTNDSYKLCSKTKVNVSLVAGHDEKQYVFNRTLTLRFY